MKYNRLRQVVTLANQHLNATEDDKARIQKLIAYTADQVPSSSKHLTPDIQHEEGRLLLPLRRVSDSLREDP